MNIHHHNNTPEEQLALLANTTQPGRAKKSSLRDVKQHAARANSRFDLTADEAWLLTRSTDNFGNFFAPAKERPRRYESSTTQISWMSQQWASWFDNNKKESSINNNRKRKRNRAFWNVLFERDNTSMANVLLAIFYTLVIFYCILIFVGPFLLQFVIDKDIWCPSSNADSQDDNNNEQNGRYLASGDFSAGNSDNNSNNPYPNPDYDTDPCRYARFPFLFYISLEECDISRRLLTAVCLGGAIGYERRSADRPAGIRTMGLVSLGACFYTISSVMAFKSSTQTWDASRVTAALPSGVGFLGGALIWKGSVFVGDQEMQQVHGLTTAASLWLSAAVGVGVGGGLYLVTLYVTTIVIMILRFGPRVYLGEDAYENDEGNGEEEDEQEMEDLKREQQQQQQQQQQQGDNDQQRPASSGTTAPFSKERERRLSAADLRKSMRGLPTFGS